MRKIIAGLVIAAAFVSPMVVNQPLAQAVTPWSTYATLRSSDDFLTSADASVYVRNPYNFRVKVKASPSQKVKVHWSYYCENVDRSQTFTVTAGNSSWVTKNLPRPSNPGDHCLVSIYVSLPNQDWDEVATVRAQLQAQTR